MAENPPVVRTDAQGARRQIVAKAAVATGLVVALLAGLLIYERGEEADTKDPVPKTKPVTGAMLMTPTPGSSVPEAAASDAAASTSASTSAPAAMPEELKRAITEAPDAAAATIASMSNPVVSKPSLPEGTYDPTVPMEGASVKDKKADRSERLIVEASPTQVKPDSPPRQAPVLPSANVPVPTAAGGFVVQLGVFTNVSNAEELQARLSMNGIPSHLETRVQVGPFKNKAEALRAQEKLKKLGLGAGMLTSVPVKH